MQPSIKIPNPVAKNWVYASLTVLDGPRQLKPSHVSFEYVRFDNPPMLTSAQIEILVANGDEENRRKAQVLPHDQSETKIPIRLLAD